MLTEIKTYGPEVQEEAMMLLDTLFETAIKALQQRSDAEGCGAFFCAMMMPELERDDA